MSLPRDRFNLIPLPDRSKIPIIPWKIYQDTKCELDIETNYAVICGPISKCIVIDLDDPKLKDEIFTNWTQLLKDTLVVQTGKKGYHIYLEPDEYPVSSMRLTNTKGQHIDVQTNGVYVVGPGSIHPDTGKEYKIISSTQIPKKTTMSKVLEGLKKCGFDPNTSGIKPFRDIAKGKITQGSRNASAFKYTINLLDNVEMDAETVLEELKRWNETLTPPLPKKELALVFESALKKYMHSLPLQKGEESKKEEKIGVRMRNLSALHEGKKVSFDCFLAALDEHKTITVKIEIKCPNCFKTDTLVGNGWENPKAQTCKKCHVRYEPVDGTNETRDARSILLKELPEETENNTPVTKTARVYDEWARLVYQSSKKVNVKGIFRSIPDKNDKKENTIVIEIESFEFVDEDTETYSSREEINKIDKVDKSCLFDKLASCYAPNIYGYESLKKCILLHLVGGGNVRREDIHILMIGNPGTGKTELMIFAGELTRSFYANGRLASGAGLAAGMVKLSTGVSIANTGPLCLFPFGQIDEFEKMRKDDRTAVLESMEQRTVSLIKNGVIMRQKSDARLLCAANPAGGRWNFDQTLSQNISLESFILSRFDIIWGFIKPNTTQRGKIAHHIVQQGLRENDCFLNKDQLRRFLNYCRMLEPKLSTEAADYLEKFFVRQVEIIEEKNDEHLPMEERQLEGLVRLSTAHAKLHQKNIVDVSDIEVAISLYKESLESFGISVEADQIQSGLFEASNNKKDVFNTSTLKVKNAEGYFDLDALVTEMMKSKIFVSRIKTKEFIEQMEKAGKVLYTEKGYKLNTL